MSTLAEKVESDEQQMIKLRNISMLKRVTKRLKKLERTSTRMIKEMNLLIDPELDPSPVLVLQFIDKVTEEYEKTIDETLLALEYAPRGVQNG